MARGRPWTKGDMIVLKIVLRTASCSYRDLARILNRRQYAVRLKVHNARRRSLLRRRAAFLADAVKHDAERLGVEARHTAGKRLHRSFA